MGVLASAEALGLPGSAGQTGTVSDTNLKLCRCFVRFSPPLSFPLSFVFRSFFLCSLLLLLL